MQGTVASYDTDTGAGSVLLDDGVRLAFGPEATAGSGLRFLRPGQRVRLETEPSQPGPPRVVSVQILTLG